VSYFDEACPFDRDPEDLELQPGDTYVPWSSPLVSFAWPKAVKDALAAGETLTLDQYRSVS